MMIPFAWNNYISKQIPINELKKWSESNKLENNDNNGSNDERGVYSKRIKTRHEENEIYKDLGWTSDRYFSTATFQIIE